MKIELMKLLVYKSIYINNFEFKWRVNILFYNFISIYFLMSNRIKSLYVKLYDGDEVLNALPPSALNEAILILGLTGAGKSTLTQLITRAQLKVLKQRGRHIIENDDPNAKVKIGQTIQSCTEIPNYVLLQQSQRTINIYDCPGFLDTKKFDAIISNSYYVYQLFSKITKIKFILAIDESGLFGPRAAGFIDSVNLFLNLFRFTETFTVDDLGNSVLVVFTKSTNPIDNILAQIEQVIEDYEGDEESNINSQLLKKFLLKISNENSIELVKAARQGKPIPDAGNILSKIKGISHFERELLQPDNKIDMSKINFQIGQKELEGAELDLAKKAFENCDEAIEDLFQLILQAIQEIRNKLKDRSVDRFDSFDFFESWNRAIEKYRIGGKKWEFKSQPTKKYLHRLHLLKQIYDIIQSFSSESQEIIYSTDNIKSTILKLFEAFAEFLKLKDKDANILKQFTFILNRKFEQTIVLQQIGSTFTKNNRQCLDILKGFLTSTYKQNQQEFIIQSQVRQKQFKQYYCQLIQFLQSYQDKQGISSKIATALKCQASAKPQNAAIVSKTQTLKLYLQARTQDQKANFVANSEYYVKVNVQLYKGIADLLFISEIYEQAVIFYKVIDSTEKIIKCYDLLIKNANKNPQKIKNLKLQLADYLRSILQFSRALQLYKDALDLTSNPEDKQAIGRKILDTYNNEQSYYKAFEQKISRGEYYHRLDSQKFNQEELLKKLLDATSNLEQQEFDLRVSSAFAFKKSKI